MYKLEPNEYSLMTIVPSRHAPTNSNSSERTLMDDLPSLPHDGSGSRGNQADQDEAEAEGDTGPLSLSDIQLIDEVLNRIG